MIIITITIFVIAIFITVLQNYFNMNVNFLSGTSKNCKIVNYFRQKNSIVDVRRELIILFCAFFQFILDKISGHSPPAKKNLVTCMLCDYFTKYLSFQKSAYYP